MHFRTLREGDDDSVNKVLDLLTAALECYELQQYLFLSFANVLKTQPDLRKPRGTYAPPLGALGNLLCVLPTSFSSSFP